MSKVEELSKKYVLPLLDKDYEKYLEGFNKDYIKTIHSINEI